MSGGVGHGRPRRLCSATTPATCGGSSGTLGHRTLSCRGRVTQRVRLTPTHALLVATCPAAGSPPPARPDPTPGRWWSGAVAHTCTLTCATYPTSACSRSGSSHLAHHWSDHQSTSRCGTCTRAPGSPSQPRRQACGWRTSTDPLTRPWPPPTWHTRPHLMETHGLGHQRLDHANSRSRPVHAAAWLAFPNTLA